MLNGTSPKEKKILETSIVNFGRVLSDLEIIEIVKSELSRTTCTENISLNMNQILTKYIDLLEANRSVVSDIPRVLKSYLKELILENIPDVHFSRPPEKKTNLLKFSQRKSKITFFQMNRPKAV